MVIFRFDHIFGIFVTRSGKVRRMDLIFATVDEQPYCINGWTGAFMFFGKKITNYGLFRPSMTTQSK